VSAAAVLTRTIGATTFLQSQYFVSESKFFIVKNGRDEEMFKRSDALGNGMRQRLGIPEGAKVLVYCGSIGPQYGVEQMLYIHKKLFEQSSSYYFLVLTNNPSYFETMLKGSEKNIVIEKASFSEIPAYLSAADFAFAIRKATLSMQGVAPIKLGEYLLMGLPVIASSDIGDSNTFLSNKPFVYLLSDYDPPNLDKAVQWISTNKDYSETLRIAGRSFGKEYYSLSASAESYHKAIQSIL